MYFANIDDNGFILGWYNTALHEDIPEGSVEVTEDVWLEAIDNNFNFYNKSTGLFEYRETATAEELAERRIKSIKDIANQKILEKYPLWKQINISNLLDGYTEADKTEMFDFINNIRAVSDAAEASDINIDEIIWE
jgi:hypothetical protein